MLYVVKQGDTLTGIAIRLGTTVGTIMNANVICNPNLIFVGQPLIIPHSGIDLPKAGGYPYYIVHNGDTLSCLSSQFSQSISSLTEVNQLSDPNLIVVGQELLVRFETPNPRELSTVWNRMGGEQCEEMSSLQVHGVFYIGTFLWETLGENAIPFLLPFLRHSCDTVRFYTVMSLGRIGTGDRTWLALQQALQDENQEIAELARIGLQRVQLVPAWSKRIHFLTANSHLLEQPNFQLPGITVPKGTPIIGVRWNIPSPTGEEGPRGDVQIYDLVQVISTGQIGYIPRVGFNEIVMV
jgi:LysM repeat protein